MSWSLSVYPHHADYTSHFYSEWYFSIESKNKIISKEKNKRLKDCLYGHYFPLNFIIVVMHAMKFCLNHFTYHFVESRTNKMALVWSRYHKAYKTMWSHSCQPRWLPVSHDTLAQEGNYLADTPGKETHLEYLHTWPEQLCLKSRTTHRQDPGESPTRHQGFQDTYQGTQKGRVHYSHVYNLGRFHTMSSTHQSAVPHHTGLP